MQRNTQVPVGKHNRQHASHHHEVATDVKQMPIRPIIINVKSRCANTELGGLLNKKDGLTRYGDSHVKDKTSYRPSYL